MRTPTGRVFAVVVTTPLAGLSAGTRYRVLGNELNDDGWRNTGEPTGRPPCPTRPPRATPYAPAAASERNGQAGTAKKHDGYKPRE
jgi:hypothetical protein